MENKPMVIPICPNHKTQLEIRESHTREQEFCGIWYKCNFCGFTTLFPSKELEALLNEQKARQNEQSKIQGDSKYRK